MALRPPISRTLANRPVFVLLTALMLGACAQPGGLGGIADAPPTEIQPPSEPPRVELGALETDGEAALGDDEPRTTAPALPAVPAPVIEPARPAAPSAPQLAVPPPGREGPRAKVALLLPLSGRDAKLGAAMLDAASLALFELGDGRLELLPRDTGGTPDGAAAAARDALASGAQLILGPLFAESARAVKPIAGLGRVAMVAFTSDARVAEQGAYVMGFTPEEQIERAIAHAMAEGLTRVAVLTPDTPYGNKVLTAVNISAGRAGGTIADIVQYPPDIDSLSDQMHGAIRQIAQFAQRREAWENAMAALERRLAADPENQRLQREVEALDRRQTLGALEYDALVLPEGGARLRAVAALLPFYDIDPATVRLIGTGLWRDPQLGREPALVGGWFAAPQPGADARFLGTFERAFGYEAPFLASLAYDAVALAAVLSPGGTPDFTDAALTDPRGFAGTQGIFRLTPAGRVERGLAVLALTEQGFEVIDPAPDTFVPVVN